jgi:tetratricopeptide (TPR) repeat protein
MKYVSKSLLILIILFPIKTIAQQYDEAAVFYNKGVQYLEAEEYQKAIENFTEAIARKPQWVDAYYSRGVAYTKTNDTNDYRLALNDLNKTIALDPARATAYFLRGMVHFKIAVLHFNKGEYTNEEFINSEDYDQAKADIMQASVMDSGLAQQIITWLFDVLEKTGK